MGSSYYSFARSWSQRYSSRDLLNGRTALLSNISHHQFTDRRVARVINRLSQLHAQLSPLPERRAESCIVSRKWGFRGPSRMITHFDFAYFVN